MITLDNGGFEEVSLSEGDVLFKRGDKCKYTYIVTSGHIACFSFSSDNRAIPIFSVRDTGLVGEDGAFLVVPNYGYNAVALSSSSVIKIPVKEIMTYLNEAGDWISNILGDLSEKLSNTTDIIVDHKIIDDRLNGGVLFTDQEEKVLINAIAK